MQRSLTMAWLINTTSMYLYQYLKQLDMLNMNGFFVMRMCIKNVALYARDDPCPCIAYLTHSYACVLDYWPGKLPAV